jgi:hypothetical protein
MEVTLKRYAKPFWVSQLNDDFGDILHTLNDPEFDTFWSLTRTGNETSLVSHIENHACFVKNEGPWTLFEVDGILDFGLVGILNSLTQPMADAGISVFAVSTFNTDFILVKEDTAEKAHGVWQAAGFPVIRNQG